METLLKQIARTPYLNEFIGSKVNLFIHTSREAQTSLLVWGRKKSARKSELIAFRLNFRVLRLEDGFLRSFGTGKSVPALALVLDEKGIYYDSTSTSALEVLLASTNDVLAGQEHLLNQALQALQEKGLSKYNHAANFDLRLLHLAHTADRCSRSEGLVQRILVVDQTIGDLSVSLGGASAQTFADMLSAAKAENPGAIVFVKSHPEVTSGRKGGYLMHVQPNQRTVMLRDAINPMSLLPYMDKVYVVTSTMGFEALIAGKQVVCFGVPWYAGWGVTDDRCKDSVAWTRRTRKRAIDELFAAAYIHYTRYLDPVTHKRGSIMDVIHWLARQKDMATQMHGADRRNRVIGVGFRSWKAANLKPMLGLHSELVQFLPSMNKLPKLALKPRETLVIWGADSPVDMTAYAQDEELKLFHLEDGFIRSVGLGSDLIRPQSLVLDERGMYFDATHPSDLEFMLSTRDFKIDDLQKAQQVRIFIVKYGITKYNIEPRQNVTWLTKGRLVVLVPGQVEDDASIRLGCTSVCTNLELLKAVRAARPDAFIVYKPHPDVLSLNRKGRVALDASKKYADHIEAGVSVVSCIDACDEVHTMTSLTGFDALLRGKKVVTYGQPFYAGWGLTEDRALNATAFERRQRRLTLDELVAGALLHYPIYWDWDLKGYTTCEAVLHRIVEQRTALEANGDLQKLHVGWWRRQWRKTIALCRALNY